MNYDSDVLDGGFRVLWITLLPQVFGQSDGHNRSSRKSAVNVAEELEKSVLDKNVGEDWITLLIWLH